ncbi:iron-containing alcohol dehydrogenase family protein [Natronorubrum sp. FCH18a]|uniref:iron-containing alcohol dehydrogenase family protein n=1 Tax=Natronorubrum sp. FCH18a TaxID=3447018 RepID=UPI003F515D14
MAFNTPAFAHEFKPGEIHYGRECIEQIENVLAERDLENALVVCGRTVGQTENLMQPLRHGLGEKCVEIFDETTPKKELTTVFDGIERVRETDADAVVGVGGGSSLDVARGIGAFANTNRSLEEVRAEVIERGELNLPNDDFLPVFNVPTTMAGADLSVAAGLVVSTDDGPIEAIPVDDRLMATGLFYDPNLFETTPTDVLAGSAINGFDKGIEAIYSRFANPLTDATAIRGLQYLRSALPQLRTASDPTVMERAVMGTILVQYGVSMPDAYKINIVHAFGHALRNQFGIQQGVAHSVIVPHALGLIFAEGCGRPQVLAEGLVTGTEETDTTEEAVIKAVDIVRDGLGLPTRLRDLENTSRDEIREVAEHTANDAFLDLGPSDFDPSIDEIEQTLHASW